MFVEQKTHDLITFSESLKYKIQGGGRFYSSILYSGRVKCFKFRIILWIVRKLGTYM